MKKRAHITAAFAAVGFVACLTAAPLFGAEMGGDGSWRSASMDASDSSAVRLGIDLMTGYQQHETESDFVAKRAFLDLGIRMNSWLDARVTPDVDPTVGGYGYLLRYAYGRVQDTQHTWLFFVDRPYVMAGLVPTPWLDFEEGLNGYRLQGPMFLERQGLATPSDYGVTLGGHFLGTLKRETIEELGGTPDPGFYGSFAVGLYNGSGYAMPEQNKNKTFMSRVTLRPLPFYLPGLQLSHHFIYGRANMEAPYILLTDQGPITREKAPLYDLTALTVSLENRYYTVVALGEQGDGNLSGSMVYTGPGNGNYTPGSSLTHRGASLFGEIRLVPHPWSIVARYDRFDPDIHAEQDGFDRVMGGVCFRPNDAMRFLVDVENTQYDEPGRSNDLRMQASLQVRTSLVTQ